ncbi:MAG: bifunctional phosphopantothenoylcysteine decarboxylase/phosphopantothenate--cysteine ligase CoaBC [Bacteroidetes bacterium]|nr:bifunctional phosphopantothenoylcysteine decarboxylase/phosphopantothenate--cysteine ligase CoaBC [Bacteroidota bacterium]
MHLAGKKIVFAVTGSIAAYKTPQLVRLLIKAGADVKVITTAAAEDFVSPLALATVSKHPVAGNISDGAAWNNHVEMGLWADAMIVAPCSANTLAKLANGLCDNLVCAVYLSARCPVFIAPAMDEDMWLHASTRQNLQKVRTYGNQIIPVAHGELASGLIGEGRMAEPEDIVKYLDHFFSDNNKPLKGTKALVTAGPTYERLDPVRFIGNFSSGKMGIAIAEALANKGAQVTLVLGPSHLQTYHANVTTVKVESAAEMYKACMDIFAQVQVAVLAAAVADYRPEEIADEKIKKANETFEIKLAKTTDILASLGKIKQAGQLLIGFALETTNELDNAKKKLQAKNADMIVLNSLRDEGAGFGHDTNKITLIDAAGEKSLPLQSKGEAAEAIVNHILELRHAEKTA